MVSWSGSSITSCRATMLRCRSRFITFTSRATSARRRRRAALSGDPWAGRWTALTARSSFFSVSIARNTSPCEPLPSRSSSTYWLMSPSVPSSLSSAMLPSPERLSPSPSRSKCRWPENRVVSATSRGEHGHEASASSNTLTRPTGPSMQPPSSSGDSRSGKRAVAWSGNGIAVPSGDRTSGLSQFGCSRGTAGRGGSTSLSSWPRTEQR
mmetsp:Transcript_27380/g.84894  ORF Transcript_27380/g.84894 Transcript_27380/m.84894 type:complete len:210 (+) Transcript_27380:1290-1919(+)